MPEIRVSAATADKEKVILYLEDGTTKTVKQGDHRLEALMNHIIPITARGEVAVVDLDQFSVYADFEQATGGVVRFFKTTRARLGSLLGHKEHKEVVVINMEFTPDITNQQLSNLMDRVEGHIAPFVKDGTPQAPMQIPLAQTTGPAFFPVENTPVIAAVDMEVRVPGQEPVRETIVERLVPVRDQEEVDAGESVVAIIDGIMIPDIDKIHPLIKHSLKTNSVVAVKNFLQRAAQIIKSRSHSVSDIMRFLEKGDLPLAEDGSVIAYKILSSSQTHVKLAEDEFVDCHTKRVKQRVGSYVCVDESLVDPNRRNECSNGLHIARRGYLGGFSGDVCVLTKIDPEDIMVVPHGDPNKVRVKGYHILQKLSPQAMRTLKDNRPMTEQSEAQIAVRNAIKGEHVGRIEEVRITAQQGGNVKITPLVSQQAANGKPSVTELSAEDKKQATAIDDPRNLEPKGEHVSPLSINKRVNAEIEKTQSRHGQADSKEVLTSGQSAAPKAKKDESPVSGKAPAKADKSLKSKAKNGNDTPKETAKDNGSKSAKKDNAPASAKIQAIKDQLPPEQFEALSLLWSGVTQSEASRKTGVSRRTIGRLTDKFGSKAPA